MCDTNSLCKSLDIDNDFGDGNNYYMIMISMMALKYFIIFINYKNSSYVSLLVFELILIHELFLNLSFRDFTSVAIVSGQFLQIEISTKQTKHIGTSVVRKRSSNLEFLTVEADNVEILIMTSQLVILLD